MQFALAKKKLWVRLNDMLIEAERERERRENKNPWKNTLAHKCGLFTRCIPLNNSHSVRQPFPGRIARRTKVTVVIVTADPPARNTRLRKRPQSLMSLLPGPLFTSALIILGRPAAAHRLYTRYTAGLLSRRIYSRKIPDFSREFAVLARFRTSRYRTSRYRLSFRRRRLRRPWRHGFLSQAPARIRIVSEARAARGSNVCAGYARRKWSFSYEEICENVVRRSS